MRAWVRSAVLLLLVLAGCRNDRILGTSSQLAAQALESPHPFVGHPAPLPVELRNGGRADRVVTLATAAPFSVDSAPVTVPGGASVQVNVTFSGDTVGPFSGQLIVTAEDGTVVTALLLATAESVPVCPTRACWDAAWDFDLGKCVDRKQADGVTCSAGACLLESRCADGICVGEAKDCDDHDACSTDACEPIGGCVHFSALARCGASSNPCQVPICDPATGCGFVDAVDGTSCGKSDCNTAEICLLGSCKTVPVTDGAACGAQSPCQPRGLCSGLVCVRAPAQELTPLWTFWASNGRHLVWDSIADSLGNVYWREYESDFSSAWLVSVTASGFPRYSVPIPPAAQMSLIEDLLILRSGATLEAHRSGDGSLKWARTFALKPGETGELAIQNLSRGVPSTAYAGVLRFSSSEAPAALDSFVAQLSLSTGATIWEAHLPLAQMASDSMPVDENGYLYVGTIGADHLSHYVSVGPTGLIRWNISNPHADPAAVFGGRVYHWDHWLSETSTGSWVNTEAPTLLVAGYPRLALGAVSYVGSSSDDLPSCFTDGGTVQGTVLTLVRVDPATSQIRWQLEIAGPHSGGSSMTNTVLTANNTILFSQAENTCAPRHVLREVTDLGEAGFSCQLPGNEGYFGEGLLDDGRWIAAVHDPVTGIEGVRAITLPGFALPPHGWATAWGSPARDNHAR